MMKATELHGMLTEAGASVPEANDIVIARIAKSECEDDGFTDSVEKALSAEADTIEKAADAIRATLEADDDAIAKGGSYGKGSGGAMAEMADEDDEDDDEDDDEATEKAYRADYDMVAIVSKGADQIVDVVEHNHTVLAKGYLALNDVIKGYDNRVASLESKLDTVLKALGQSVPPRSVTAAEVEVVDSPGEVVAKGGVTSHGIIQKAMTLVQDVDITSTRAHELTHAVALLESGANPATIATNYNIH